MPDTTTERHLTVDLKTGKKITFSIPGAGGLDSEKIQITITHETKAGRLARLSVAAPAHVKIGFP